MWKPSIPRSDADSRAIFEALRWDIESGLLRPGDRLPPQRELAAALGVNLSTVSRAYQEASRLHLIGGEVGRGTYVLPAGAAASLFEQQRYADHCIDLSRSVPAPMPDDGALAGALAALSPGEQSDAARYSSPEVLERARSAAAQWLTFRGLAERPETVILCAGAHAALMALLLEKAKDGDPILVESFSFPGLKALAKQLRLRLVPVDQDGEGVTPEALDAAARASNARLAVLVPNLQNPTGAAMGDKRRADIAQVVARHDLTVIEDDVYGALSGRPLLSRDLGHRGIVVSSLSKTVMPGLRFGFIAGGSASLAGLRSSPYLTNWMTAPLSLVIGAAWIENGTALKRLDWQQAEVAARWEAMVSALGPTSLPPSPHAWLTVEDAPEAVVERCRENGVAVASGNLFATGRRTAPRIRICLTGARSRTDLDTALAHLSAAGARL
ncbi:PLP-dependent aminotransferase family protein [Jiella sp. M17.18]|uniref:aminotransferase-like domain-containing protein n=1 Tax=Jiella sp. M17.18 TaxID=3234247 RepID=UPI0034DDE797